MIGEVPRRSSPDVGERARVSVRQCGADELDPIMAIMEAAFPTSFGEAWTRSQCAGIMPMAGVALRVAEDADRTIRGFSLMRIVADEAELLLIAVDPVAQQQGIGGALLDDFRSFATSHGARRLHLEVRDGNRAITLYEATGFTLAGRRRAYYRGRDGATHDALTLAWEPPAI